MKKRFRNLIIISMAIAAIIIPTQIVNAITSSSLYSLSGIVVSVVSKDSETDCWESEDLISCIMNNNGTIIDSSEKYDRIEKERRVEGTKTRKERQFPTSEKINGV